MKSKLKLLPSRSVVAVAVTVGVKAMAEIGVAVAAGIKASKDIVVAIVAGAKVVVAAGVTTIVTKTASTVATAVMAAVAVLSLSASLSGCVKLWEEESREYIPLPETGIHVTPDPWEPPETDENEV